MRKILYFFILLLMVRVAFGEVLIVADEFPAMEVLAAKLKSEEKVESKLIAQKDLPEKLADYDCVIVYIHKALSEKAEEAFIDYTKSGGKLLVLHHSIGSSKRRNPHWFSFLGVTLPEGDVAKGGYKWIEGVKLELVNRNPDHFIMTNRVAYPERILYTATNAPAVNGTLPGFILNDSEVYLNHVNEGPRTLLMGLKYVDGKSGITYMQDRAGWIKPAGKGQIIYLMPGHRKEDFENPTYARIVLNAVICKP
jgi:Trehalose utilisation